MVTNSNQVTVNPPVPVSIVKFRVYGSMLFTLCVNVIRIKKHLHNGIEIVEIERQ